MRRNVIRTRRSIRLLEWLICFSILGINPVRASGHIPQTSQSEPVINWEDLRAVYNVYIHCPSPENAKALLNALPVNRPEKETGDAERALLHIFGGANFPVLDSEVRTGERSAVEIMVRFLNITDGAYTDTVEAVLAGLVRSNPRRFLEVLLAYKGQEYIKKFGYPVNFVGEGYQAHPCALRHEYEKRIEALEGVKDPIYAELIEACIKKLREAIKEYTQKAL